MVLHSSHKGLPRWSYVMILVSLLPPELLLLLWFSAAVDRLPFFGYRICVNCRCCLWDTFCTPFIISETSRFCLGLSLLVVTEAVALVLFLFLLRFSVTTCALSGSFIIRFWVLQMSHNHSSFPYHLVGLLISKPFSLWFPFPLPRPPRPPRPPLPRPPIPPNFPPLPPPTPLPDNLSCPLRPYLPDFGWVAWKRLDITIDRYVEAVSELALWIYMQMATSVLKLLFGQSILSRSCLTLFSSYGETFKVFLVLVTYFLKEKMVSFLLKTF